MTRRGRGGGNRFATMGEVHERKEATCEEQLTTHLQHMEERLNRFERFGDQIGPQIGVLTKQLAAMGSTSGHRR